MEQEEDKVWKETLKLLEESETLWFTLSKEEAEQLLIDSSEVAWIVHHLPLPKYAQIMFILGYYFGKKEK